MKRMFTKYPVLASRSTTTSLGQYSKWYKFASDADLDEFGCTREDVDMTDELADYDIDYVGTAVVRTDIREDDIDALVDEGYDLLSVGRRRDNNEIGLFMTIGRSVISATIEDIERVLGE